MMPRGAVVKNAVFRQPRPGAVRRLSTALSGTRDARPAMSRNERIPAPSERPFARNAEVPAEPVAALEGAVGPSPASLAIKALLTGRDMLLMEVRREKGRVDPEHAHPDHESICYLVRGRMRVVIDGESFIAEPGDAWVHRPGVPHWHEALEDSLQLEVKTPPRRAWRAATE
jgi:quercetin dioxygenase-like cupin family protein